MEERNQQTKINHHSRCRPDLKVLSTGAVDKEDHDNINLRLQPPTPMYNPSFEMPAIRDYSLDNIRLTPPQIYTPPMHIYEPPVYIPPPVIVDP